MNKTAKLVAILTLGLLPNVNYAEYYGLPTGGGLSGYNSSVSKGISTAKDTFGSGLGTPGAAKDSFEELEANIAKIGEQFKRDEQEVLLRGKVSKWTKDIDNLRLQKALPDLLLNNALQKRQRENKRYSNIFSGVNQFASKTAAVVINTNNAAPACGNGVDFNQFTALMQQMQNGPVADFMSRARSLFEKGKEEDKEKAAKQLAQMASTFTDLANKPPTEAKPKKDIFESNKDFTSDKAIKDLEATGKKQQSEITQLRQDMVRQVFGKLIPDLAKLKENDAELEPLKQAMIAQLEGFRAAAHQAATIGADQLWANCKSQLQTLGPTAGNAQSLSISGQINGTNTMLGSAYAWAAAVNPAYADGEFMTNTVNPITSQARCENMHDKVDATLGQDLFQRIQAIKNIREPGLLVQTANKALEAVANSQNQIGNDARTALNQCDYVAKNIKLSQDFIGQRQAQVNEQSGAAAASTGGAAGGQPSLVNRGAGARRSGRPGAATHNPAAGRI